MFWLCTESYRGTGRLSRSWIEKSDERPDKAEPCQGVDCYCQGNWRAHVSYPFNDMGGRVESGHDTLEEAKQAEVALWNE